jgi:membrane protein implicated in regulation of membrane protease activity
LLSDIANFPFLGQNLQDRARRSLTVKPLYGDSDIPQHLPVEVGKQTMVGKTANALCPIDSSGGKVFVEDKYWTATSDRLVEIAVEGLTTKVKPET